MQLILSDGERYFSGLIGTQLNHLVESNSIVQNCLLRITGFVVNTLGSEKKAIIITNCEVAGMEQERIGNAQDVTKVGVMPGFQGGVAQSNNNGGGGGMYGNVSVNNNNNGGTNNPSNNNGGMGNQAATNNQQGGGNNPYGGNANTGSNPYGKSSGSPIVRTGPTGGQNITPISSLNMYSNRWVIQAKITNKSDVRHWTNAKGEGSLFSIVILDSSGYDVKCTFFKESVEKFGWLEEGKVYTFSGGRLKVANMQYNNCKSQFEITFDNNSEIHLVHEAPDIVEQYDFKKIAELENIEPGAFVDILGVVKHVGDVSTIISKKSGKEMMKCELVVEDDSMADVRLTLWGNAAESAATTYADCPVVAFKKAKLSDYGGRSLSGGNPALRPNIRETEQLQQWWAMNGNKTQSRSLSSAGGGGGGRDTFESRKEVCSIKQEHLGNNDKPDYLTFKATFNFIKREKAGGDDGGGCWYTACANSGEPCKNMYKATQTSDGNFHCDKCQQTYPNCVRRFIVSACVADDTATTWVSLYNEQVEPMVGGVTADQLYENYAETNSKDMYDSVFLTATYTEWVITCKVKQELVGDETRTKSSVVRMSPVDYAKETKNMLTALAAY
jgi:replication factor A1